MKKNTIVLTTGGTGGHVFPAESVASYLKAHANYNLVFVTDKRVKDKLKGTLASLPVYYVCAASVTGKGVFGKAKAAIKLVIGTLQSLRLLIKLNPKMVVGFGGYASIPATLAAQFLHIPVVLHEQNAILGKANRLLARRTRLIATSFTPTERIPEGIETVQTGMPVRPVILQKKGTPYSTDTQEFRLLIMGGSQGARALSALLPKALVMLSPEIKGKLCVTEQVRAEDMEKVKEEYRNSGIKSLTLAPFFDNIPELLANAHLVISRAGSSSLAEFSALARPALLLPLPTAADDHQTANAKVWCTSGGGWLIIEKQTTPEAIAERLTELIESPEILRRAAQCLEQAQPSTSADEAMGQAIIKMMKDKK